METARVRPDEGLVGAVFPIQATGRRPDVLQ
jgi:hypothetical protein